MDRRGGIRTLVAAALLAVAIAGSAPAQTESGRITGTILTEAGQPVAEAEIVARSLQTGVRRKTKSSSTGTYSIPYIRAGVYEVTVEARGMERAIQQVRVIIGTPSRLDFTVYPAE